MTKSRDELRESPPSWEAWNCSSSASKRVALVQLVSQRCYASTLCSCFVVVINCELRAGGYPILVASGKSSMVLQVHNSKFAGMMQHFEISVGQKGRYGTAISGGTASALGRVMYGLNAQPF
jgi:hypothetical protein